MSRAHQYQYTLITQIGTSRPRKLASSAPPRERDIAVDRPKPQAERRTWLFRVDPLLVQSPNIGTADGTHAGIGLYQTAALRGLRPCRVFQARAHRHELCPLLALPLPYLEFAGVAQGSGARVTAANTNGKSEPVLGTGEPFKVFQRPQRITANSAEFGQRVAAGDGSPKGAACFFF